MWVPQIVFGLILVGSREAMEGEQTPIALISMAIIGLKVSSRRLCILSCVPLALMPVAFPQVSDIDEFVAEFGEEEHEPKPTRRRSITAAPAIADQDDGARSMRRPAAPGDIAARERELEAAAASAEMAPASRPGNYDDFTAPSRDPQFSSRDDYTTAPAQGTVNSTSGFYALSVSIPPPAASFDTQRTEPTVASAVPVAVPPTPAASVAPPTRRISATTASTGGPPVYAMRTPGRRGSALADDPDSLQAPSAIARAEALARRASLGGGSPMAGTPKALGSPKARSSLVHQQLQQQQQQGELQSPSFVARMEAARRGSDVDRLGAGDLSFQQAASGGTLSRASQR